MQNLSGTSWSDQFHIPGNTLGSTATTWKDMMNNFLMESTVFQPNDINQLKSDIKISDPTIVMNLRHELVRNCSTICRPKIHPMPKEDIMTEARRLIRKENLDRLAKEKETRIVNKEIEQLKQDLESNRQIHKMELETCSGERKNNNTSKYIKKKNNPKMWKRFESYDSCWEIDSWFASGCGPYSTNVSLQEKCQKNNKTLPDFKVTFKKKEIIPAVESENEDSSSALTSNKDSEISFKTQIDVMREETAVRSKYWDESHSNGKNEIMQRFFQSASEIDRIKQVFRNRAQIQNSKTAALSEFKETEVTPVMSKIPNAICPVIIEENLSEDEILEDSSSSEEEMPIRFKSKVAQLKLAMIKDYIDKWNINYYWKLWKRFILDRKSKKEKLNREEKIETFLKRLLENKNDKLELEENFHNKRKEKRAKNSQSSKTIPTEKAVVKERLKTAPVGLESRFREQKKKIKDRKLELMQSESENAKLQEIELEVKESSKEAFEHLNKNFDPSLRGRVKVLRTISNIGRNRVEKIEAEMQKVFPVPEVLSRMAKRDQERKKRWEEIRERKTKLQEEKEKQQKEKEEQMKMMEENEKKRKLEEAREKRRLDKEAEEERRRERELLKEQTKQAQAHYKRALLWNYGLNPWKCLITFRKLQEEQAIDCYCTRLKRGFLLAWKEHAQEQMQVRQNRAEVFYDRILMRQCLQTWIEACNDKIKQYQAAVDWADLKLTETAFKTWIDFAQEEQLKEMRNKEKAELFHQRKLKSRYLRKWIYYPELMRLERDKEDRKRIWRQKVQEVLPDFRPLRISETM